MPRYDQFGNALPTANDLLPAQSVEEERSLADQALGLGASGLSWLGGILGKPKRVLWGALTGNMQEALGNLVPYSDRLGITDPSQELHGRQILGVAEDAPFFSPEGLASFGVDIAMDPLSWLGGPIAKGLGSTAKALGIAPKGATALSRGFAAGTPELEALGRGLAGAASKPGWAMTAAEEASRRAGALGDFANLAGRPLGGHLTLGLPGGHLLGLPDLPVNLAGPLQALRTAGGAVGGAIGQIPLVGPLAGRLAGTVGSVADTLGNAGRALFQKSAGGQVNPELQNINRAFVHEPGLASQAGVRGQIQGIEESLTKALGAERYSPENVRLLRDVFEGAVPAPANLQEAATLYQAAREGNLANRFAMGLPSQTIGNQTILAGPGQGNQLQYMARYSTPDKGAVRGANQGLVPAADQARKFQGLTANSINDLATSDLSHFRSPHDIQDHVLTSIFGDTPRTQLLDELSQLRPQAASNTKEIAAAASQRITDIEVKLNQAQQLANWKAKHGVMDQVFKNDPVADLFVKQMKDNDKFLKAGAIHEGVARLARPAAELGADAVPLSRVLQDAGLTIDAGGPGVRQVRYLDKTNTGLGTMARGEALEGSQMMTKMREAMFRNGKNPAEWNQLALSKPDAEALTRIMKASQSPEGLKPFVDLWDSITNINKSAQTVLWPANHARNQGQAMFMALARDVRDPAYARLDPRGYIKAWTDAKSLREGGVLVDANKVAGLEHLSPEAASKQLMKEVLQYDAMGHGSQLHREANVEALKAAELLPTARPGILQGAKQALQTGTWNPLDVAGVGIGETKRLEDANKFVKAGRSVATSLDDINRMSTYIAKRRQGMAPTQAIDEVLKTNFDFANMSQFEKGVMRRVVPFYGWMRQSIPSTINELVTNPGGPIGTAVRAVAKMRDKFTPANLGGGVAVPIGQEENGTQRYLSRLGLSVEELGDTLGNGLPGLLGTLNPLLKMPIELGTNRQLFTGRDLSDLHSRIGDVTGITPPTWFENLAMNSPAGRFLSSASTAMDQRKSLSDRAVNLATGLRLSDIDMQRARDAAIRGQVQNQLRGVPGVGVHESLYIRPEQIPMMSPQEQALARYHLSMQQRQQQALQNQRRNQSR